jgi:DNA-binding NtrC family response regulator
MARTRTTLDSLPKLLDRSGRPIYAIDSRRRVVYCNSALAGWLELAPEQIVGRVVEYHSVLPGDASEKADSKAPLADLCPPPRAFSGDACSGTISCAARGGRLAHRQAEFIPIDSANEAASGKNGDAGGVLVLLSTRDMSPVELAAEVSSDPSADQLHRTIRQFRRAQTRHYAIESLLGSSPEITKVRAQVAAAATSGANVLILGRPGSGRGHVARAIHYHTIGDSPIQLMPVDCALANEELLRRALDSIQTAPTDAAHRHTLLLENLDRLDSGHQVDLATAIQRSTFRARVVATCNRHASSVDIERPVEADEARPPSLDRALHHFVSTITIRVPPLAERIEDFSLLTQAFLEARNRGSGKQVGSIRGDALDQLVLYCWPGELDELRGVIAAAHAACTTDEITPADLPTVVHHAVQKASRGGVRPKEHIVLDDLLAQIEREAIVLALDQANGNKTEAAELLGMTRPRLYRRLVQLGMATESADADSAQMPQFIEQPAEDET